MGPKFLNINIDWALIMGKLQEKMLSVLPVIFKVFFIIVVTKIVLSVIKRLAARTFMPDRWRLGTDPQRLKTINTLLQSGLRYFIYFFAGITILSTVGVKTESLLASAGIVGLAVGFGAQSLVQDVLTGFFIIFEDQFVVGDYIVTANLSGVVEEMGLRITRLRDYTGLVHTLPNSKIKEVSNHSRDNRVARVDIPIAYQASVPEVETLLQGVLTQVAKNSEAIIEGPRLIGMMNLEQTHTTWRIWARTRPMQHWAVEREIRRTVKIALDEAGFQPPYPRAIIYQERSE